MPAISGRPDGRLSKYIYAEGQGGVCRDMRYSAYGVDSVDFAEADQRVKNGTYRGFEFGRITKVISFVTSSSETNSDYGRVPMTRAEALRVCELIGVSTTGVIFFDQAKMGVSLYNPNNGMVIHSSAIGAVHGNSHFGTYLDPANPYAIWLGFDQKVVENNLSGNQALSIAGETGSADSNIFCSSGQTLYAIVTTLDKVSVGGSFMQTDVIGNPANILATPALANGWQGSWIPIIHDGLNNVYKFSRKCLSSSVGYVYSGSSGANWGSSTGAVNISSNSNNILWSVNDVALYQYQAFAKQTENAVNGEVYGKESGIGRIVASSSSSPDYSVLLGESLCGVIGKNDGIAQAGLFTVNCINIDQFGKISSKAWNTENAHIPLTLATPTNNSPAFKALNYNVNTNQQAFIQYAYAELKHNGTNWGDDGKVTIVDNQSTKTDLNGNTVLVGTAKLKEPIGWIKQKI